MNENEKIVSPLKVQVGDLHPVDGVSVWAVVGKEVNWERRTVAIVFTTPEGNTRIDMAFDDFLAIVHERG